MPVRPRYTRLTPRQWAQQIEDDPSIELPVRWIKGVRKFHQPESILTKKGFANCMHGIQKYRKVRVKSFDPGSNQWQTVLQPYTEEHAREICEDTRKKRLQKSPDDGFADDGGVLDLTETPAPKKSKTSESLQSPFQPPPLPPIPVKFFIMIPLQRLELIKWPDLSARRKNITNDVISAVEAKLKPPQRNLAKLKKDVRMFALVFWTYLTKLNEKPDEDVRDQLLAALYSYMTSSQLTATSFELLAAQSDIDVPDEWFSDIHDDDLASRHFQLSTIAQISAAAKRMDPSVEPLINEHLRLQAKLSSLILEETGHELQHVRLISWQESKKNPKVRLAVLQGLLTLSDYNHFEEEINSEIEIIEKL